MVMEASPSPQSVGREFVRQYYTLLNKAPAHLHRFYNNYSSFVHGGLDAPNRETLPVVGQKQIHNRIQQLNFRDCHAKISQVDAQATLGNGVVVQVTGELSNGGAPMRRFTQTFVLAAQTPKKYYVHNDIFRYQDIVFSDESGSGSGPSEAEEEPESSAFPPPPPPQPFVPSTAVYAQPPPVMPQPSPPAVGVVLPSPASPAAPAPHLNGHPPHDDASVPRSAPPAPAPAPAPLPVAQAPVIAPQAVEREPESESAPEPAAERESPPPAAAPAAQEPKTYANLLKSSVPPAAPRAEAQHPPAAHPAAPRPTPARHYQPPAEPANTTGSGPGSGSRRYSDSQQLFLGNLPHSATEEELRALFGRFGVVAELRVHSKLAAAGAPRHPNYGFITYETAQAAHDCLNAAPLYFPSEGADGVKLNVEEKKARGRERRRQPSAHRSYPRPPYRR